MTIPVTILGGFLGAGKTTVVNRLLADATDRVSVLVNDFGAVNIDARLIDGIDGDLVALSNGCVCCSLGSDLSTSLARVAGRIPAPDRILIEASGVSDPWRIAQLVRLDPALTLDAVVVLVDALHFTGHLADPWLTDTLERQLARADLIAFNKVELVSGAQLEATRAAVLRIRPDARLAELPAAALPELMFAAADRSRFVSDTADAAFHTWRWRSKTPVDEARLKVVLSALPSSVLRAKGLVRLDGQEQPSVLQMVGKRWSLTARPGSGEASDVVLIGTDAMPSAASLSALFDKTLVCEAITAVA